MESPAGTLYVDVDETLILWADGAGFVTEWEPNPRVFAALRRHAREFEGVIIWSSGGGEYAWKMWHHERLREYREAVERDMDCPAFGFIAKYPALPSPGDVFIDDDPWPSFAAATIHPGELL